MAQEVELKFDVDPGDGDAIRGAGIFAGTRPKARQQDSLYYDTPDGAVRRAGFSLRVRRSGQRYIQTIKRRSGRAAGLFVRQEWETEVPSFALDRGALDATPLKRWLAGTASDTLVPLVRTRLKRTAWQVRHERSWVEIVLDEGVITKGKARTPVRELELELIDGEPAALFALAGAIAAAVPLRLGVLSKAERGYALADGKLGRPAKAEPIRLKPPATEAEAFHAIAQACLRHFRLNEMVLLGARDPDALHQARVAIRRLRSALSLFRPALRGTDYQHLREELRWFAREFGDARNLDVLIARAKADEVLCAALQPLRAQAYDRAAATLRSERAQALMLRLSHWVELGDWRGRKHASRDLGGLATEQLERQWKRIARRGDGLAELDAKARHGLRIAVKKLRYAAEFMAPLYTAKPLSARRDSFLGALKALQERLGDLNDAWTAESLAARLPAELRPTLARIHAPPDQRRALRAAEKAFRRAAAASGYWRGG